MTVVNSDRSLLQANAVFNVSGSVVVVTGGASGLGYASAEVLAANGAVVTILDRNEEKIAAARTSLSALGVEVHAQVVDVTDPGALKTAIDAVVERFGRLDVVFANAGINESPGFLRTDGSRDPNGAIENIAAGLWDKTIGINLTAVLSTIQAAVPHLKKQGHGRIIVTSSAAGLNASASVGTPYAVSKAGVAHLVKQAALELTRYGITVNGIIPGPFRTALVSPDFEELLKRNTVPHRIGAPEEIRGLALFLASNASSYVNGAHIVIDGGVGLGRAD